MTTNNQIAHLVNDGNLPPLARNDAELVKHGKAWADRFAREAVTRLDVNESGTLALQLEHLFAQPINRRYARLMAKELIPPAPGGIPAGATTVATYGMDEQGAAEILHSYATKIPLVDIHARKMTAPIVGLAAGFSIGIDHIAQAAMSGMPLPTFGLDAAVRAVATLEDTLLSVGSVVAGLQGLLRVTGATTGNMTTGAWAGGVTTADQIVADVDVMISDMELATGYTFYPTHLVIPPVPYAHIQQMPRFAIGGPTVLQWIEQTFGLKVVKWWRCAAAFAPLGADTALLFDNSREVVEGYWPISPELLAPEYHSTHYLTVAHARCGGVNSANPLAIRYAANV